MHAVAVVVTGALPFLVYGAAMPGGMLVHWALMKGT